MKIKNPFGNTKISENVSATPKARWRPIIKMLIEARPPWHWYILVIIIMWASSKLQAILPAMSAKIAAGDIFDKHKVIIYVALALASVAMRYIEIFQQWVTLYFAKLCQLRALNKLLRLPMKEFQKLGPSNLVSRVIGDASAAGGLVSMLISIVFNFYLLFLILKECIALNGQLSLFVMPLIVVSVIFIFATSPFAYKFNVQLQNATAQMTGFLAERLNNIQLIKALTTEKREIQSGYECANEMYKTNIRLGYFGIIRNGFSYLLSLTTTITVLIVVAMLVQQGVLELKELIAFYLYVGIVPMILESTVGSLIDIKFLQGSTAVIAELNELAEEQICRRYGLQYIDEIDEGFSQKVIPAAQQNNQEIINELFKSKYKQHDIVFNHVSFGYNESSEVLHDLSFTIPAGKKVALVGASGSGKTTVLRLLERMYEPQKGSITYGGINLEDIHLDEWRKNMSSIIQNAPVLSGTIASNIAYGAENISMQELKQAAIAAGAYNFIEMMDDGFASQVGELGSKLSGGQRQRVAIARAIASCPGILLIDEGTANLDGETEAEVTGNLDAIMQGKTCVVVAHNLHTIENADKILVMKNGRIVGEGTHTELAAHNEAYQALLADKTQLRNPNEDGVLHE